MKESYDQHRALKSLNASVYDLVIAYIVFKVYFGLGVISNVSAV